MPSASGTGTSLFSKSKQANAIHLVSPMRGSEIGTSFLASVKSPGLYRPAAGHLGEMQGPAQRWLNALRVPAAFQARTAEL